jgi:3-deoxy-manno-octulosonate cytidylyltransferase (CMP-KDO synthetase)
VNVVTVVPFRLASARFPDKPLATVAGQTLIERALGVAAAASGTTPILTGPEDDYREVQRRVDLSGFPHRFVPTSPACRCATERVLEISRTEPGDRFVSLPIDEAALRADEVARVLAETVDQPIGIMTLVCDFFCMDDARSPLSAKVVVAANERVLWMSRSLIPVSKSGEARLEELSKHVGVFVFGRQALDRLWDLRGVATRFDAMEGLEQLRWLELGLTMTARRIRHVGFGIDSPEQIEELEKRMAGCSPKPTKSA